MLPVARLTATHNVSMVAKRIRERVTYRYVQHRFRSKIEPCWNRVKSMFCQHFIFRPCHESLNSIPAGLP
jgi:hypothetical protein